MDYLKIIEINRNNHGYLKQNYNEYKQFNNKMIKKCNQNKTTTLIYKLEVNLAKWFKTNSIRYLRKNIRILNKQDDNEFVKDYKKYILLFISKFKNEFIEENFAHTWNVLNQNFYYSFNMDLITLNDDIFDINKYRIKYMWNDIQLMFDNQAQIDNFLQGVFNNNDFRFNTQMARYCHNFDKNYNNACTAIKQGDFVNIFNKIKIFSIETQKFTTFLDDNFITSAYLTNTNSELNKFYKNLSGYIETNGKIKELFIPSNFAIYKEQITTSIKNIKITKNNIQDIIMMYFKKFTTVNQEKRNMPLMPVFYDLAFDYIQYPDIEIELSNKLASTSINK